MIKRDKSKDLNSVTASSDKSKLPRAPIPEKGGVSTMRRLSDAETTPVAKKPTKKKAKPVKKVSAKKKGTYSDLGKTVQDKMRSRRQQEKDIMKDL